MEAASRLSDFFNDTDGDELLASIDLEDLIAKADVGVAANAPFSSMKVNASAPQSAVDKKVDVAMTKTLQSAVHKKVDVAMTKTPQSAVDKKVDVAMAKTPQSAVTACTPAAESRLVRKTADASIFRTEATKPVRPFDFPFEPYPIQLELMQAIHTALTSGRRGGIFESPTGTGKSLSLLCACLTWLSEEHARQRDWVAQNSASLAASGSRSSADDNDWIAAFAAKRAQQKVVDATRAKLEARLGALDRLERIRRSNNEDADEVELTVTAENNLDEEASSLTEDSDFGQPTKILFASRTHSQLAQVMREFGRTRHSQRMSAVCLAARSCLCVNSAVTGLGAPGLVNERCLELRRKASSGKKDKSDEKENPCESSPPAKRVKLAKSSSSSGCPFYRRDAIDSLAREALRSPAPLDIEDLVRLGRERSACPYYAARRAAPLAQLVLLPYQSLLHKGTRLASGLSLRDHVLVIDEAHNLLETLASVHSVCLTSNHLASAVAQLAEYEARYLSRLAPQNLLMVRRVKLVAKQLLTLVGGETGVEAAVKSSSSLSSVRVFGVTDFHLHSGIDNVDLPDLLTRLRDSRLSRKVGGGGGGKEGNQEKQTPLLQLQAFLTALLSSDTDGRVLVQQSGGPQRQLKYLLLNPAAHFAEVVEQARCVILAGGTMRPVDDLVTQLFQPAGCKEVELFSCGHVVPRENVLAMVVGQAPALEPDAGGRRVPLTFTHAAKSQHPEQLLSAAGDALLRVMACVPAGAVVFFPSHDWEAAAHARWLVDGRMERLRRLKRVFREPQVAAEVEPLLRRYQTAAVEGGGAVLFAVVGGRLSEGINFSDDYGRCVVMLGMPYPNVASPELKETMNYLSTRYHPDAGQSHYESLCMRAVNQCIGRAIRHRADYAAIVLMDSRYARPGVRTKLPDWIAQSLLMPTAAPFDAGQAAAELDRFFTAKRGV